MTSWFARLLKYVPIQCFLGLVFCTFIPSLFFWWQHFPAYFTQQRLVSLIMSGLLVVTTLVIVNMVKRFPGIVATVYLLPIMLFWFAVIVTVVKLFSLPYLLTYYCLSATLLLIYLFIIDMVNRHYEHHVFAYIPVGRAVNMPDQVPDVEWLKLETTHLNEEVTAIVTDLHSRDLGPEWEKFIAEKTLQRVPVYHHRNIRESLTGRVRINHLYENELGSLLPSENYMVLKWVMEVALIILSLPLVLPIMIITAIVVKFESDGPVLFKQKRVGLGGREFTIYKFRSMTKDSEKNGAKMASEGDMRVTRVGRFIRKTRIDELPQFWNIIKGDMSLIGPRPEQKVFVEQFQESIPFYNYRHIVKPGITGWAQVTHGYAGNEDETRIKVEHDFYYIKHYSFSLDLLIFFKTIYTMATGFGAR